MKQGLGGLLGFMDGFNLLSRDRNGYTAIAGLGEKRNEMRKLGFGSTKLATALAIGNVVDCLHAINGLGGAIKTLAHVWS